MKREDLIVALGDLGYPLIATGKKKITAKKIMDVLDGLASSDESRLIEGFPVILAHCAHKGVRLNIPRLLSMHGLRSNKRRNLEKLLLLSAELFNHEKLEGPEGLDEMANSLKAKYGTLLSAEVVGMGRGVSLSKERLLNTLRRYTTDLENSKSEREKQKLRQQQSFQLHMHLSTLFSPKQKELVLKKLKGESFSKTEQEYYSRVVKKKLEALANSEVRRIATTLTKK
jgi:hypothetical protein